MSTTFRQGVIHPDALNTCDICGFTACMGFEMVHPGRCFYCTPDNLPVLAQPLMVDLPIETLRWQASFWEMVALAGNTFDDVYYASRARDLILDEIAAHEIPAFPEDDPEPLPAMIELSPVQPDTSDLVCAQAEINAAYRRDNMMPRLTTWRGVRDVVIADWMAAHGLELGAGGPVPNDPSLYAFDLVEQRDGQVIGTIEYAY